MTIAFGTTAPLSSVTCPVNAPVCAKREKFNIDNNKTHFCIHPILSFLPEDGLKVWNGPPRAFSVIMTTFKRATLTALLFAFSAFANDHAALNGTWTLVPTKSDFAGQPVMQTGTVTIDERQGNITVTRNFAYEGATETFFYRDMTDSQNGATIHTGKNLKSKARWEHDALKVTTTDNGATTQETYTLSADGTMAVNVFRPDRKPFTLIFQRK
jgi:hypothetical protein